MRRPVIRKVSATFVLGAGLGLDGGHIDGHGWIDGHDWIGGNTDGDEWIG